MKIAICIDKSGGILFNKRRLSQDSVLRQKLLELAGDGGLYLNEYSAKQFETGSNLAVSENFIEAAGAQNLCFVENVTFPMQEVTELYLFNWNRAYPADTHFKFNAKEMGFKKVGSEDLVGSSHKKITLEVFKRV